MASLNGLVLHWAVTLWLPFFARNIVLKWAVFVPKVFKVQPAPAGHKGEVIAYKLKTTPVSKVKLVSKEPLSGSGTLKIEDAEVIVAGGRGMGSEANFKKLEELAALFENAAVAGSRAAVDEKWIGHAGQVGQSGKTVTPKLYFACGISGALATYFRHEGI
jgi:electron transfer flavoprotein alpha subunit